MFEFFLGWIQIVYLLLEVVACISDEDILNLWMRYGVPSLVELNHIIKPCYLSHFIFEVFIFSGFPISSLVYDIDIFPNRPFAVSVESKFIFPNISEVEMVETFLNFRVWNCFWVRWLVWGILCLLFFFLVFCGHLWFLIIIEFRSI